VVQELMKKGRELFLDHFARLGLFGKVLSLAGPQEEEATQTVMDKVIISHYVLSF